MSTFYTIDGIDDAEFPPAHPEVIKFFNRESADKFLAMMNGLGLFQGCHVAEHEAA